MESEVDLDEEIKKLHVLATAPQHYPILVNLNVVSSMIGLLAHENPDISADIIDLLAQLTEPDNISEIEQSLVLINAIVRRNT
jgi:beta-catenin-like protein 1